MKCPTCSNETGRGARYCPHCHAWLGRGSAAAAAAQLRRNRNLNRFVLWYFAVLIVLALLGIGGIFAWQGIARAAATHRMKKLSAKVPSLAIDLPGGSKMEFVWCPPGEFVMGNPESGIRSPSNTLADAMHIVRISRGFWMARHEVTQKQWNDVMGGNPSIHCGENLPVENVARDDIQTFCRTIRSETGRTLRLPSSEEWEYACRAGTAGPVAGTGNLDQMAWYGGNCGMADSPVAEIPPYDAERMRRNLHPVGKKAPNAWGLYDMQGNVWEFCRDEIKPSNGQDLVVLRGGSVASIGGADRLFLLPRGKTDPFCGFRPVLEAPPPESAGGDARPGESSPNDEKIDAAQASEMLYWVWKDSPEFSTPLFPDPAWILERAKSSTSISWKPRPENFPEWRSNILERLRKAGFTDAELAGIEEKVKERLSRERDAEFMNRHAAKMREYQREADERTARAQDAIRQDREIMADLEGRRAESHTTSYGVPSWKTGLDVTMPDGSVVHGADASWDPKLVEDLGGFYAPWDGSGIWHGSP